MSEILEIKLKLTAFCFLGFNLLWINSNADDFLLGVVGAWIFEELQNLFGFEACILSDAVPVHIFPLIPDLHREGVSVDQVSWNSPAGHIDVTHIDGNW